jgi:hypothetical protein
MSSHFFQKFVRQFDATMQPALKHRFKFSDPTSPQPVLEEGDVITFEDSKAVKGGECIVPARGVCLTALLTDTLTVPH